MTRILIVGAGGTGGALGAHLVSAGRDVTFLVRERRAAQLRSDGLRFRSPAGETTHQVNVVTTVDATAPVDLVIVAVKAPALADLIPSLAPAIGSTTRIVPLLNGMAHMDQLEAAYPGQVLGGITKIVATIDEDATVVQMTPLCSLTIGDLNGDAVSATLVDALSVPGLQVDVVDDVVLRLWEKWAFIAAAGVITCLFRGTVGDIIAAGGEPQILEAIDECQRVAAAAGYPVTEAGHAQSLALLNAPGSAFTSSLYRDLQHGDPLEAEHIVGNLAARAAELGVATPLLDATIVQLRTHHQALLRAGSAAA